jgi:hypothetical protein
VTCWHTPRTWAPRRRVLGKTRSTQGVIRFRGEVKPSWPPGLDEARPAACHRCAQPAYEAGRIRIHGHGLVRRQQRGPVQPGEQPVTHPCACRRYLCKGCGAVFTVLPASAQPRKHFSGAAIALALALWGLCGLSAAQVRAVVSDWVHTVSFRQACVNGPGATQYRLRPF